MLRGRGCSRAHANILRLPALPVLLPCRTHQPPTHRALCPSPHGCALQVSHISLGVTFCMSASLLALGGLCSWHFYQLSVVVPLLAARRQRLPHHHTQRQRGASAERLRVGTQLVQQQQRQAGADTPSPQHSPARSRAAALQSSGSLGAEG